MGPDRKALMPGKRVFSNDPQEAIEGCILTGSSLGSTGARMMVWSGEEGQIGKARNGGDCLETIVIV